MLDMAVLAEEIAAIVSDEVERRVAPVVAQNKAFAERIAGLEAKADAPVQIEIEQIDWFDVKVRAIATETAKAALKEVPIAEGSAPLTGDDVRRMVADAVAKLPSPKDGRDGIDGKDGIGKDGVDGIDGKDGAGIADLIIDRAGNLVATFTDGRMKELGSVVGRDGKDGEPGPAGRDALALEDFEATVLEDGRVVRFAMTAGDIQYAYQLSFPVIIDRGVWTQREYAQGDAVTWAGSLWIAQRDTDAKPDTPDGGWRLAVKRGRDGKDKA